MAMTKKQVDGIWTKITLATKDARDQMQLEFSAIRYDTPLIKAEHRKSRRVFAATEYFRKDPFYYIHIHTGLLRLPKRFVWGILLHEAGHVATWGKDGSTEDEANDWVEKCLRIRLVYENYRGRMIQAVSGGKLARKDERL